MAAASVDRLGSLTRSVVHEMEIFLAIRTTETQHGVNFLNFLGLG